MRQGLIFSFLMALFCGMFMWAGYVNGKRDADRWYAQHQPVAATPQIIDNCATISCPNCKLIPPIKVRAAAPTAQMDEPR